ncbi:MAG: glucose-1-phosphate adenylyltransferase family protein [Planctomycetota bacterium]
MQPYGWRDLRRRSVTLVFSDAGAGLFPLTRERDKLTVPFGGEYRMIDFVLSNCLNSGLRRIRVFVRRRSPELDRHLQMGWKVLSGELGEFLDVVPSDNASGGDAYGAGAAVLRDVGATSRDDAAAVCALIGDQICRTDYGELLRAHAARRADLTVACRSQAGGCAPFGTVEADDDERLRGVACGRSTREGEGEGEDTLVPTGAYVFSRRALLRLADELGPRDGIDLFKDVVPAVVRRGRAFAWVPRDPSRGGDEPCWRDVRTIDAYHEASTDLVGGSPALDLYDETWPMRTHREQRPPTKIVSGSTSGEAERSIVGAGCLISGGRVEGSVLFPCVRLHDGSLVSDSVLMRGVTIGAGAVVRRAILDEGASVAPGERIGVDPELDRRRFTVSPGGVVVVPRETRAC